MTLTIELSPEEERRVEEARRRGIDVQALIKGMIAGLPEAPMSSSDLNRTAELFAQWAEEDAAMTPEQIAQEDALWDEVMQNIKRNRLDLPVPDVSGHD